MGGGTGSFRQVDPVQARTGCDFGNAIACDRYNGNGSRTDVTSEVVLRPDPGVSSPEEPDLLAG